jgi:FkbM family methyltransferase
MRIPSARTGLLILRSRLRQQRDITAQRRDAQRRQRLMVDHYRPFVRTGALVFDIGANHGERTAAFRALGARVIAAEPQPACVNLLRSRFASDGAAVQIVPAAIAAAPGTVTLRINSSDVLSSITPDWIERTEASGRFDGMSQWTGEIEVESTTLDALIEQYGVPAFCKVDVEGAEPQVFAGLSQPVGIVSYEFASEAVEATLACLERLEHLGAAQFSFSSDEAVALEPWVDGPRMRERLASLAQDPKAWGDVYARFA